MKPLRVVILKPEQDQDHQDTNTPKEILLANEYGRDDDLMGLKEYLQASDKDSDVVITPITLKTFKTILMDIKQRLAALEGKLVVVNLCDGTESSDGYPGLSVVVELERLQIPFTGSGSSFFEITTSKPVLKELLIKHKVPTSLFVKIDPQNIERSLAKANELIKWPLIVKPSVSYASISITTKSVVSTEAEALDQISKVLKTTSDGVFLESFLAGREFTALCTGSSPNVKVYLVAERVFNSKLKEKERILAFDKCKYA